MNNNQELIIQKIRKYCGSSTLWVAYSGGMDSHVLLHFLATHREHFPQAILAVHVDHQLQPQSGEWGEHCRQVAESLHIPFHLLQVNVTGISLKGIESAARTARYQAMNQLIGDEGILLTGQHLQDQSETLLLQLLRGAGTRGLGAMKTWSVWQKMPIFRPFLSISREELNEYAMSHKLNWIDDPSNQDIAIQRNFLRHNILPLLQQRWPAVNQNLARSSQNLQESQLLLDEIAEADLIITEAIVSDGDGYLDIHKLLTLNEPRQRNLLRLFIKKLDMTLPSRKVLQRILDELCLAAVDAQPQVHWHHSIARRYQNQLHLNTIDKPKTLSTVFIQNHQPFILDDKQQLVWKVEKGNGIRAELFNSGLTLKYREGGEQIQLKGKSHHQSLKKLFQQWQIPVWKRHTIPLLFAENELVAIVGYACAETAKPESEQTGWLPTIEPISLGDFN